MYDSMREPDRDSSERARRSYRRLLAASIFLAAIGAPILMQGAVFFAQSLSHAASGAPSTALWGLGVFALSSTPLGLAGYTWRRTHGFQELIDLEQAD